MLLSTAPSTSTVASTHRTLRVANISEHSGAEWRWILDRPEIAPRVEVTGASTARTGGMLERIPGGRSLTRYRAAAELAAAARQNPFDLVISHGPLATAWTAEVLGRAKAEAFHLAYAFNFTDLPTGLRRAFFTRAFAKVDRFVVFTRAEQQLYAEYFGIPAHKLVRAPWGVSPTLSALPARTIEGPYFAALGGEARDYETLCAAARLRPDLRFVVIARPWNFAGITAPANMDVRFDLPLAEALGLVAHAEAAIVPLRGRETPCGLVTVVGGMHLGKAQVVTEAAGVADYIAHERTGLMVPPRDPEALAAAIDRLMHEPGLAARLGHAAREHATRFCCEANTVELFSRFLDELGRAVRPTVEARVPWVPGTELPLPDAV